MTAQLTSQEKMLATIKKHEKLVDLAKRMNTLGKITEVLFLTLSDLILPEDKVLLCYYQLQTSEKLFEGQNQPQFYSCEVNLITVRSFIHAGFFQTSHTVDVKNVDHISDLTITTMFGNQYDVGDEGESTPNNNFEPSQVKVGITFNNSSNQKVASWDVDTTDMNNISLLMPQVKALAKHTGVPLTKVQI